MTRYGIGLGSNVGDRLAALRQAVAALEGIGVVSEVSSLYETEPVGGPTQGPFLNAVAVVDSDLAPSRLLEALQDIESAAGRVRHERWGPRILDLDILATDGPDIDTESLQVPHPRLTEREFALRPLAEIWPEARAGEGLSAAEALRDVEGQGVAKLSGDWVDPFGPRLGGILVAAQFAWFLAIAVVLGLDGSLPGDGEVEPTRVVGIALTIVGGALAFVSSRRLGAAATPLPEPGAQAVLVTTGPYALARHPIYGGVILFMLGTSLILDSLWGVFLSVALAAFFYFKSEYEESRLLLRFPEYAAYRDRVPRRLIPFVL